MATNALVNNFTGGEISPLLWSRTDLEKYSSSCRVMENLIPLQYGGVRRRPGTIAVAYAKTENSRLLPFRYSVTTNFLLEIGYSAGAAYVRFFSNHAQIMSGGSPYEISAPYGSIEEIRTIQYRQINDIMYLVCPTKPVYKLSRLSDTSWTLAEVAWDWPAMRDENITSTTLTLSAETVGTGRTLTASSALFDPAMVGGYFQISHLRNASSVEIAVGITTGIAESLTVPVKGPWSVVTTERWCGELQVQRSYDGGSTWEVTRRFRSAADRNVNATGVEERECLMKLYFVSAGDPYGVGVWAGTPPTDYVKAKAKLECESAFVDGLVKVTGYTSTTAVTVSVLVACASVSATKVWREGAWSKYRGFPRAIGFFEQSLVLGGNESQPNHLWKSKTGDFENFYPDESTDDASTTYQAASAEQSPINWVDGRHRLLVGAANQELAFFSSNDEPLSPTNVSVRTQSNYGSLHKQAVPINDVLIFIERASNHFRELSYDVVQDSYVAPDISLLAEHLFSKVTIQDVAVARMPEPVVLVTTSDGVMRVLVYNREQNVTAWSRWTVKSHHSFKSVASIYGDTTDEVWALVTGPYGKAVVVYFAETDPTNLYRGIWTDLSQVYPPVASPYTVSYTWADTGETVQATREGEYIGDFVLTSGHTIDLEAPWTYQAVVGYPVVCTVSPTTFESVYVDGPTQNSKRRISKACLRFKDSLQCSYGTDLLALSEIPFEPYGHPSGSPIPFQTGVYEVSWEGGSTRDAPFYLQCSKPLPFTLLSIAAKWEVNR